MSDNVDTGTKGIADLNELASINRAFQTALIRVNIMMNIDNKLGQTSGQVAK